MPLVTSLNWIRISVFCSFNAVMSASTTTIWETEGRGTFSGFEDEGDAVPSFIFDVKGYGRERRTSTVLGDSIVFQVAWFPFISNILSNDHIFRINRRNRPQHTDLPTSISFPTITGLRLRGGGRGDLFITNILCTERDGSLHCHEREHLQ